MSDHSIEQEIQAKGKTAARVTPQAIQDNINFVYFFTASEGAIGHHNLDDLHHNPGPIDAASLGLLTFCVLVLKNGFTVTGESACASPENFDADIGRKVAYENAVQKIWPLMGYELKQRLFEQFAASFQGGA